MEEFTLFFVRYLHVLSGIMWIGILWYFNFVQIPSMAKIPADQKPAITKVIAPEALFWFRWGAAGTVLFGLMLAYMNGYIHDALTLRMPGIGFGMWLGLIMAFNVWVIIWPAQKIALGMVDAEDDARPVAGRKAMLFSRANTLMSIPMLFSMISAQNPTGF